MHTFNTFRFRGIVYLHHDATQESSNPRVATSLMVVEGKKIRNSQNKVSLIYGEREQNSNQRIEDKRVFKGEEKSSFAQNSGKNQENVTYTDAILMTPQPAARDAAITCDVMLCLESQCI